VLDGQQGKLGMGGVGGADVNDVHLIRGDEFLGRVGRGFGPEPAGGRACGLGCDIGDAGEATTGCPDGVGVHAADEAGSDDA